MYNYKNLMGVREAIHNNPKQFDMRHWCGTTLCIAGWGCFLYDERFRDLTKYGEQVSYVMDNGHKPFDMDDEEAKYLFMNLTNHDALEILDTLIEQKDKPLHEQRTIEEIRIAVTGNAYFSVDEEEDDNDED